MVRDSIENQGFIHHALKDCSVSTDSFLLLLLFGFLCRKGRHSVGGGGGGDEFAVIYPANFWKNHEVSCRLHIKISSKDRKNINLKSFTLVYSLNLLRIYLIFQQPNVKMDKLTDCSKMTRGFYALAHCSNFRDCWPLLLYIQPKFLDHSNESCSHLSAYTLYTFRVRSINCILE